MKLSIDINTEYTVKTIYFPFMCHTIRVMLTYYLRDTHVQ